MNFTIDKGIINMLPWLMSVNYKKPSIVRDFRNGSWFWIHTHIWRDKRLTKGDRVTYGTLASYVDNNQHSYPSIQTIADDGDLSPRQVHYSIKKLEQLKYIKITRRRGKPNYYDLLKTTPAKNSPLQSLQTTPAKTTVPIPAKTTLRTISNRTISNNKMEEEILIPSKKTNPLTLTRGQTISFLKAFPTLTSSELKEQMKKCNTYMGMSSEEYKNPGLFFRKWLERYSTEKRKRALEEKKQLEQDNYMKELSEEEKQNNVERIKQIKEKFNFKSI